MSNELANPKYPLEELLQSEKFKRNIGAILKKEGAAERFIQIGLNALTRQPALKSCSQESILTAILKLAQIGLEPDGYHAHLVPYGKYAQLIIDYKGLITIIRRNPKIAVLKGNVVYKKDKLVYREGSDRFFAHIPTFEEPSDDNPVTFAYSFVKFVDGDWDVDILPAWKVEMTRDRSKARDSGPWMTDYDEMAIKTAIRHHSKRLPLQPEEHAAVRADDDQYEFNPFEHEPRRFIETSPKFDDQKTETNKADKSSEDDNGERQSADTRSTVASDNVSAAIRGKTKAPEREQNPFDEPQEVRRVVQAKPEISGQSGEARPENHGTQEKPTTPKGQTLLIMINRKGVTQDEVLAVLKEHEMELGEAEKTGIVTDLPEDVLTKCIKHWGSIQFSIEKNRVKASA